VAGATPTAAAGGPATLLDEARLVTGTLAGGEVAEEAGRAGVVREGRAGADIPRTTAKGRNLRTSWRNTRILARIFGEDGDLSERGAETRRTKED